MASYPIHAAGMSGQLPGHFAVRDGTRLVAGKNDSALEIDR
jgi:hypothetical protein